MAKFLNSGALAPAGASSGAAAAVAAPAVGNHVPVVQVEPVYIFHSIGCWALAFCNIAPQANDWMLHMAGAKAYLYYLGYPVAIAAFLFCGTALRGLHNTVGKLWLLFSAWLILDVPFSVWRGGSVELLKSYLVRDVFFFFIISALAINLRNVKFLLHAAIFGAFMVLGTCIFFGREVDGRFAIPNSSFFASSNELAIELIINIGLFSFLLSKKNFFWKLAGSGGIVLSAYYLLRTGSRGGFVAGLLLLAIAFFGAKNKLNALLPIIPILLIVPLVKHETLMRLVMIYAKPEQVQVLSDTDEGVIASQVSRQHLLRRSLEVTFTHPLFGVGPGQFIEATEGADRRKGKHSPALGTHNSYTQVSSECGLVAFVCFMGVLVIPFRRMRRLYKETRKIPELKEVSAMAHAIFLSLAGYCGAIFFHHVAYTGYLPQFSGLAMALFIAAEPLLARHTAPEQLEPAGLPARTARPWVRPNGQQPGFSGVR